MVDQFYSEYERRPNITMIQQQIEDAKVEEVKVEDAKAPFYQAIGILQAELHQNESGAYYLQWRNKSWLVSLRKRILTKAPNLLGQLLYWRVYPQPIWKDEESIVHRFTIVNQPNDPGDLGDGEFKLAGCWQAHPRWEQERLRQAHFTVYRNPDQSHNFQTKIYYHDYALNWDEPPFVPGPNQEVQWHSILAHLQENGIFDFVRLLDGPKPAPDRLRNPDRKKFKRNHNKRNQQSSRPKPTPSSVTRSED